RWQTPNGSPLINDIAMKWFFIIPPVLVGLTSYIGLRRLGYQPMRRWLVPYVGGLTAIMEVQAAGIFLIPGWLGPEVRPYVIELGVFLLVLLAPMLVSSVAVFALPESRARKWIVRSGLAAFLAFAALVAYFSYAGPQSRLAFAWVLSVLEPNMNTLLLFPMFAVLTAYLGVPRPYDSPPGHVPRAGQRGGRPDGPRDQGRAQVRVRVLPGLRRLLRRRDAVLAHELRRHESRDHLRFVGQAVARRRHPADDPGPIVHEVLRPRPAMAGQGRRLRADAGVQHEDHQDARGEDVHHLV